MYNEIKAILPQGATIEYEADKIPYVINYTYNPDYTITFKDGRKLFIEAKGAGRQFDDIVRRKMVAVKEQNDIDLRIIFYRDGEFGARKKNGLKTKQSSWAEKVGYPFSVRKVIEEWFE